MAFILASLGALILVIILIVALYFLVKAIKYLAINTVIGLVLLALLKWLGILSGLQIGLWDVVLSAVGGVIGVFIVIVLYFLGYDI
ncbi:MAG: hypothetical protein HXS53_09965 [Theionarchaea archaeon]|nr:hypothetical protein [Theionarchaea archaeon]